jgi:DNA-binding protein H-NS
MDLAKLSSAQLRDLQQQLQGELKQRTTQDRSEALEKIHAIARSVGLPLKELVGAAPGRGGRTGTVAAQFRNPADASQQWTGRGRQPKWVKDWVDGGNDIAGLKI